MSNAGEGRGRRAQARAAREARAARPEAPVERAAARKPRDALALVLSEALEARLDAGHPWIYRDHVPPSFRAKAGDFVHVECGRFDAWALWDAESPIALRVFSRQKRPDAAWVKARVDEAWELRQRLLPPNTDAFRLLFGEGDGLPGIVVDVYAGFAIVVSYSSALGQVVAWVAAALAERPEIQGVCERVTRRKDRVSELRHLSGLEPPEVVMIEEQGLRYEVDFEAGQKTGLFLDHRANRHYLRGLAAGRRVLNLFSYTGAFSVSCAAGGASHVTSVDIAAPAIEAARRNVLHNALPAAVHEGVAQDVFEFLAAAQRSGKRWDLVIADPPSFASSRAELFGALRAYRKLHAASLSVLTPGGLYAGASCTAQVSPDAFRQTLAEGAARAGQRLTVVHEAAHAVDHPYAAGHLEGRYLKFVLCRALPLA
ncbi:MAG TPA: class I SAM-dependent rRNA methyltransferase [Polyangiaceae bacterium]|nr:class I SAM-dependent rRNA methyltransferase [Polyangiaceae bacterium]